jgi:hypothetical protein
MALTHEGGGWRVVDRLLAGYGGVVAAVAATRLDHPGAGFILGAHLGLIVLALLASRAPITGLGGVLRAGYPVFILTGLYASLDVLIGRGAPTWDAPLLALEEAIFGNQPARDWWRAAPSAFWSTLMHAVYFSYYFIVPLPVLVLLLQRRRAAIEPYLNGVVATFLACYLIYLFFPVSGPYYQWPHPDGAFVDNAPARWVYAALAQGSSYGAAFPSSHVAATVAATMGAWVASRPLGIVLAVPTALLTVGVVYTQMHYVVDSVAGVLVGIVVPLLVARYAKRAAIAGRPSHSDC